MINQNNQLGESSSFLSTRASLNYPEVSENIPMYNNYGDNEEAINYDTSQENPSRSFLTDPIDMNAKSLVLIHQSPLGWHFVSANLKLMAAGKANLDVVLYVIETFMQQLSLKPTANIENLKNYFESLKETQKKEHQDLFRRIAGLILDTPKLFPTQMDLLIRDDFRSIELSQRQCLCLVAHMFMCISVAPREGRVVSFESIFYKLQNSKNDQVKIEKIKCIINYFTQAFKEIGERKITFERIAAEKVQQNLPGVSFKIGNEDCSIDTWKACEEPLLEFAYHKGGMEGNSKTIEIGFSSKSFGGQTLKSAATQQEMIILKRPECLPGFLLFDGPFDDGEAFGITGARSFNKCIGYDKTFQWEGSDKTSLEFVPKTVFIDACDFSEIQIMQFSVQRIQRELTKAFIGFLAPSPLNSNANDGRSVTTGRWGSGINGGNAYLKFLIQWIAASRANRRMDYYAFDEKELTSLIGKLGQHYQGKQIKHLMEDLLISAENAPKEKIQEYDLFTAMKKQYNWK